MTKKLRLSICVVTYNHEKYIAQALDSFLMQETDFAFQVIVGDDCSTDNTVKILKEYAQKYPEIIKPIIREKNIGAINNSLDVYDHAKTEYVAICDGDDYWTDSKKLQKQVDFLDRNLNFSICFHPTKIVSESGGPSTIYPSAEYRFNRDVLNFYDLLQRNPMHTNSIVYRWRFVNENIKEMMPNDICPGDLFLAILHAEKGSIKYIDEVMSVYRRHGTSLSTDLDGDEDKVWLKYGLFELNFFKALEKHFKYSISEQIRTKKIDKCVKVLKAFIKYNATDQLEILKRDYPEYYNLGLFHLETTIINKSVDHYKLGKEMYRIKRLGYVLVGLLSVNLILILWLLIK